MMHIFDRKFGVASRDGSYEVVKIAFAICFMRHVTCIRKVNI